MACRGWSAGLVKSGPKFICREDSLSPYGCLKQYPRLRVGSSPASSARRRQCGIAETKPPVEVLAKFMMG